VRSRRSCPENGHRPIGGSANCQERRRLGPFLGTGGVRRISTPPQRARAVTRSAGWPDPRVGAGGIKRPPPLVTLVDRDFGWHESPRLVHALGVRPAPVSTDRATSLIRSSLARPVGGHQSNEARELTPQGGSQRHPLASRDAMQPPDRRSVVDSTARSGYMSDGPVRRSGRPRDPARPTWSRRPRPPPSKPKWGRPTSLGAVNRRRRDRAGHSNRPAPGQDFASITAKVHGAAGPLGE
jgi:hypothetical protein